MNFPKTFLYYVSYVSFFSVAVANTYWQWSVSPSSWWTYASAVSVVAGVWATWYGWTAPVKSKVSPVVYGCANTVDDKKKAA